MVSGTENIRVTLAGNIGVLSRSKEELSHLIEARTGGFSFWGEVIKEKFHSYFVLNLILFKTWVKNC